MTEKRIHEKKDLVWYGCYGSNLCRKRFLLYIGRCTNKAEPIQECQSKIPYDRYFSDTKCDSWPGSTVAFLDKNKGSGMTKIRCYLITNEQFKQVKKYEGKNYTLPISLGTIDGIAVMTFTSKMILSHDRKPSGDYKARIVEGEQELESLPFAEIKD